MTRILVIIGHQLLLGKLDSLYQALLCQEKIMRRFYVCKSNFGGVNNQCDPQTGSWPFHPETGSLSGHEIIEQNFRQK